MLVIACGAVARELVQVVRANGWRHLRVRCLPAELHSQPRRIAPAVRAAIAQAQVAGEEVFVAYADCGTGGALDEVLQEAGVARLPGAHCYEFLAGAGAWQRLCAQEPGSFFLTDFLVRHFERLVWQGLGLDRWPQLRDDYFRNYRRVVHLAQADDEVLESAARAHAARLGLAYHRYATGLEPLRAAIALPRAAARPAGESYAPAG